MRLWLKTLFRNSFFLVGAGIFVTMLSGGLFLRFMESGPISENENPFWWAIVTMTTVGYGDFSPETSGGRLVAVLVMFAGISLVSMLTATISSIFVAKEIREGKGLEQLHIQNHLILCGWNQDGENILEAFENLEQGKSGNMALINELKEEEIRHLKNRFKSLNIQFVAGDFTQEDILVKANLSKADTVIIIPNRSKNDLVSADERTIFATLTIKSLAPNVKVVAYISDRNNLTHIKRANADEVIVGDDLGTAMLVSHVMSPGVPQAVNRLLNSNSKSRIRRMDIPPEFVGLDYNKLFDHFRREKGWILIGVYSEDENLGIGAILSADSSALDKFIERKLKDGGISLQDQSKINVTVNPNSEYLIKENERAIIIP